MKTFKYNFFLALKWYTLKFSRLNSQRLNVFPHIFLYAYAFFLPNYYKERGFFLI